MSPQKEEKGLAKPQVSFRVDEQFYGDLKRWAHNEELAPADFVRKLVRYAASAYERAGSLHALRTGKPAKVSELTHVQVYSALDSILEHGPPAVVERVVEFLTDRAGKYGPR